MKRRISSDNIVLKLATIKLHLYPTTATLKRLAKIVAEAKNHAKTIRALRKSYWTPSVDRLCRCGHSFKEHSSANCEHEVGGDCMRHTCTGPCNHAFQTTNSHGLLKNCQCPGFRDCPENKVRP